MLFALVANRALAPGSKLAAAGWVNRRAHIDGLPETSDDACYRAMDWLLEIAGDLEREVFWQVATLLDHEVDLLFFDTTSTYFETDDPDPPVVRDTRGQPVPDRSPPPQAAAPTTATDADGTGRRASRGHDGRPTAGHDGRGHDGRGHGRRRGWGSGPTASRRTPATTCPRS